jgi:DNA-binding NarL/FixJ family response regulator
MQGTTLIVDPDPIARIRFADALRHDYQIIEVDTAETARLIALRMPLALALVGIAGEEGFDLLRALRNLDRRVGLVLLRNSGFTATQVQLILQMSARVTKRDSSGEELRSVVRDAIPHSEPEPRVVRPATQALPIVSDLATQPLIDQLRLASQAYLVIFTDYLGNLVMQSGDPNGHDISAIASLVASSFVSSVELGQMVNEPETLHLSVHEGRVCDIYSVNCGRQRLLSLIINKIDVQPKLGYIWMLMKRVSQQLTALAQQSADNRPSQSVDQLSTSLNDEFDRIFGGELFSEPPQRKSA